MTDRISLGITLGISLAALCVSLVVVYLSHWKPARLNASRPRSFMAARSEVAAVLRLPVTFWNDGAKAVRVFNLRLIVTVASRERIFTFLRIAETLTEDPGRLATQFIVDSRQSRVLFCDFERRPSDMTFQAGVLPVRLEAQVGNSSKWKELLTFELRFSEGEAARANTSRKVAIDTEPAPDAGLIDMGPFGS